MNIKPEELTDKGYVLMDSMSHSELVPFVSRYMKEKNLWSVLYYVLNLLFFVLIVGYFLINRRVPGFSAGEGFVYLAVGIALTFALIPLHELIHALAYRSLGAVSTSYDVNWRKFYFMAIADKFVADRREFTVVALAPFVSISLLLIALIIFTGPPWTFAWLGTLLTHTSFCSGDFALLSYFRHHKKEIVVTYDDKENSISHFFKHLSQ